MAIICQKINLLYIQVPGTGCSVVARLLKQSFGGTELGRKHASLPELLQAKLITKRELRRLLVVANLRNPFDRVVTYYQRLKGTWLTDEYLAVRKRHIERAKSAAETSVKEIVALERNFKRAEKRSHRRAKIIKWVPFNVWLPVTLLRWKLQEFKSRSQSDNVSLRSRLFPLLDGVDVVLRQETLEKSLNKLFTGLDVESEMQLERRNITSGKRPYSSYYSALNRWLFNKAAGGALQEFGYDFERGVLGNEILTLSSKGKSRLEGRVS